MRQAAPIIVFLAIVLPILSGFGLLEWMEAPVLFLEKAVVVAILLFMAYAVVRYVIGPRNR